MTRNTQHTVPNRPSLRRQTIPLIALVVVALGFAARLYHLASESLWYDELLQLDIAQAPLVSIFPRLHGHAAVPLDYLISHFWILLGRDDVWVRIPAVVLGTLTLPLIYRLGRRLLGPAEGLLLMALLAGSLFHVRYSQEVRPYALVVLGVTLAVYAFWRLRATGRWPYIFPLQIGVLIFALAHFFALAIFGPLLVLAVIDLLFSQNRKRAAGSLIALAATTILPLLILLSLGWGSALFRNSQAFGQALVEPDKFNVEADQKPSQGLGPQVDGPFIRNEIMAPLAGSGTDITLWLFNVLAGIGLLYLLTRRQYKLSLLLLLWLLLPIIAIISFLIFRDAFFAARYIIFILPAYLMLLAVGLLALPRWLRCAEPRWLSGWAFVILAGFVFANSAANLNRLYVNKTKENWHIVGDFIARNAGPHDAVMAMRAEPALNWYYLPAWAAPNYFWDLEIIQETAAKADRSWIILSLFSASVDDEVVAWLDQPEHKAVRFDLDPIITVYYFSPQATSEQLLAESRSFALPVDHALYASLAQENQNTPAIARQYYQLAIEHAPTDVIRAQYRAALEALARQ